METQDAVLRIGSARDAVPRKRPRVSGAHAVRFSARERNPKGCGSRESALTRARVANALLRGNEVPPRPRLPTPPMRKTPQTLRVCAACVSINSKNPFLISSPSATNTINKTCLFLRSAPVRKRKQAETDNALHHKIIIPRCDAVARRFATRLNR